MYYHTKIGRFSVGVSGVPTKFLIFRDAGTQPLKMGRLIPGNTPLPYRCYHRKFGRWISRLVRNYGDPSEKFDPSRPAVRGHFL